MIFRERWKDIVGYENLYLISDFGRILNYEGNIIKQKTTKKGYKRVNLSKNGKQRCFRVHRLVALTFIGPCPIEKQTAHKNGKASDNRLKNLKYSTSKENHNDMLMHGTRLMGSKHHLSKIEEKDVKEIRKLITYGTKHKVIAVKYGIHPSTVSAIATKRSWRHLV